jgi:soluble cytochrome b562
MHLGRFHAIIDHLENHFREAKLAEGLEAAAASLDQFEQTRAENHIADFRERIAAAFENSEHIAPELLQPYAQQVIDELSIRELFPPSPRSVINETIATNGFNNPALSTALKKLAKTYSTKITLLKQLDSSLRGLNAEYTEVEDEKAEVGLLLPREIVGDKLPDLSKEFDKISNLARAVNELTGEQDYDSRIATISSSWWQVFIEVPIDQVALWVLAIERIVALFKSNLEIKNLQNQLGEKSIPEKILKLISEEVDKKVTAELTRIASDIMKKFNKIEDKGRKNEVEIQFRQGLHYLARRLNEGAQVEINVGVPEEPKDPDIKDGELPDTELLEANALLRSRIANLRSIRIAAQSASETSLQIAKDAPLLLEDSAQPVDQR